MGHKRKLCLFGNFTCNLKRGHSRIAAGITADPDFDANHSFWKFPDGINAFPGVQKSNVLTFREYVGCGFADYYNFLKNYHKKNFFVKIAKFNTPIGTGDVVNTNFCNISVCKSRKKNKVIIISTIDNLIKGASGQAVQNMNVAYKLRETMGLL